MRVQQHESRQQCYYVKIGNATFLGQFITFCMASLLRLLSLLKIVFGICKFRKKEQFSLRSKFSGHFYCFQSSTLIIQEIVPKKKSFFPPSSFPFLGVSVCKLWENEHSFLEVGAFSTERPLEKSVTVAFIEVQFLEKKKKRSTQQKLQNGQ